jgi:hypothetical protein
MTEIAVIIVCLILSPPLVILFFYWLYDIGNVVRKIKEKVWSNK